MNEPYRMTPSPMPSVRSLKFAELLDETRHEDSFGQAIPDTYPAPSVCNTVSIGR